jgi:glucokinase
MDAVRDRSASAHIVTIMPARRTIGVDMGGTKLLAGAVDSRFVVHHRVQRSVAGLDQSALLDIAVDAVEEARQSAGAEVAAVGFGIPCLMDQRSRTGVVAVNLPLADVPFADVMTERLGMPVFVDNDANVAALAEHRAGAARGFGEAVVLTIGTGIGGGLILRGELYRGAIGAAAELGHMVIDMNGPPCQGNCPNRGCFEALASGTALAREALRIARERPDSRLGKELAEGRAIAGPLVTELAHDGDPAAIEAIELIGERLGVAITSFANIFNPEVVVVGGGVIAAGELLLAPARAVVASRALPPSRDEVRIVAARFGVEAGMIGAAALAFDGLAGRAEVRS